MMNVLHSIGWGSAAFCCTLITSVIPLPAARTKHEGDGRVVLALALSAAMGISIFFATL